MDELDGISPAKVISECLLSNYNVCQPCANVPITAIIGHGKDYCSILWMEKLRLRGRGGYKSVPMASKVGKLRPAPSQGGPPPTSPGVAGA